MLLYESFYFEAANVELSSAVTQHDCYTAESEHETVN